MSVVMSNLFGIIMLIVWLFLIPVLLGLPFAGLGTEGRKRVGTALVCGYMEMWAIFQVLAVGLILATGKFNHVVYAFMGVGILGAAISVIWVLFRQKRCEKHLKERKLPPWKLSNKVERMHGFITILTWAVFVAMVVFQVIMSGVMAFGDGDDAFYIPISAATESSGNMYRTIPYTGEATTLDVRHALAPFPVWIAFLSRISGIHATILAQSILGGVLLVICYLIYDRIAHVLFADNKEGIPVFMLLVSVMILFGNYSFYSAETFLITRASQGKAVLGNLIVPFLFWCILQMAQEYGMDKSLAEEHRRPHGKSEKRKFLLLALIIMTTMAAWLCSSLGTFLCAALIAISGVVVAIAYKNVRALLYAMACVIPSAFFAILYLFIS